jgi:hypothetical protein
MTGPVISDSGLLAAGNDHVAAFSIALEVTLETKLDAV